MTAKILQGDCLETLKTLDTESVQCAVTSPPYYGLRDYGTAKWLGGDPECDHQYQKAGRNPETSAKQISSAGTTFSQYEKVCKRCDAVRVDSQIGLEESPEAYVEKLVQVFREVRRVLADDGTLWLNLGDSYWANRSVNGQSYDDNEVERKRAGGNSRPDIKPKDLIGIPWMVAFALRADSWYLRSDIIWHKPNPMPESVTDRPTKSHEYIFLLSKSAQYFYDYEAIAEQAKPDNSVRDRDHTRLNNTPGRTRMGGLTVNDYETRNKRSVWTVTTKPYKEAHFATFPPDLIEPCILAGSREGDTVLDPFNGSGTTGAVAIKHRRNYIGCELNPDYIRLTNKRLGMVQPVLFAQVQS